MPPPASPPARGRRPRRFCGVATAAVLALASCGGDEPPAGAGTRGGVLTVSVVEPSPGRLRYLAPEWVPGGVVTIRFANLAGAPRKAQLWRISGRQSVRAALRARRPLPAWLSSAGGGGITPPGGAGSVVQRLEPGR